MLNSLMGKYLYDCQNNVIIRNGPPEPRSITPQAEQSIIIKQQTIQ